jgi:hypothetical protein
MQHIRLIDDRDRWCYAWYLAVQREQATKHAPDQMKMMRDEVWEMVDIDSSSSDGRWQVARAGPKPTLCPPCPLCLWAVAVEYLSSSVGSDLHKRGTVRIFEETFYRLDFFLRNSTSTISIDFKRKGINCEETNYRRYFSAEVVNHHRSCYLSFSQYTVRCACWSHP